MKRIKGFTMIELLIVIAVLGILAIAVLAAINPIEQINRGRDTGSRSDAEQLLSAIDRYNASQMVWPWQCSSDSTATLDPIVNVSDPTDPWLDYINGAQCTRATACEVLEQLSTGDLAVGDCDTGTEEIKMSFVNRITNERYNDLHVYFRGDPGDSVYVCFSPQSGSFADEAQRRCDGTLPDDLNAIAAVVCGVCPPDSGTGDNCICLP